MIELMGVTKKFGEAKALDNLTLRVQKGEIFAVAGPNGSGKTTMLRVMAGIDSQTSGQLYFQDSLVTENSLSLVRKKCTLVFQKVTLFNTTVYSNISYGLKLRGYAERDIDETVKSVLEIVKMSGFEDRSAKRLSGGEQQRVSLARALALNTDVLLLDEPTANLDPKNVSIVEEAILRVNRERGTTIVMATHNMFQAETLADRAALLIGGRIAQIGTTREIFRGSSEHLDSFARLENVFSGTARTVEGGLTMIDLGNGLSIEAAVRREGKVTAFVRPEDIILSSERLVSSARNVFLGRVTEVSDLGDIVKLRIDAGREFTAQITKRSFKEMKINIGSQIHLTFKASSVRLT